MNVDFCPIASGSNGNCAFVGAGENKFLVDVGLSGIEIQRRLEQINVNPSDIDGIFITHEHDDHIRGAGILSRRFNIPIYATAKTWNGMERRSIGKISFDNKIIIEADSVLKINEVKIKAFNIPHDAQDPVGYNFFVDDFKISVATDIGHVNDYFKENIYDSDVLLIEANHDVDMLEKGSYPYLLKRRILSDNGHLSNENCGKLITDIVSDNVKYIYLGHLSGENNKPMLAFNTIKNIIIKKKIHLDYKFQMAVANRYGVSDKITLSKELSGKI